MRLLLVLLLCCLYVAFFFRFGVASFVFSASFVFFCFLVTFHLELHITKLIAVYYTNLLITHKMGLFRPRIW